VVKVVGMDVVGRVVEHVERPDAEHEDDAARLDVRELYPLREVALRALEEIELRADLLVGLRLTSRLAFERGEREL
jgi:hypothetical protein